MEIKDKVIVVSGAAGLIGRAFCSAIMRNKGIPILTDVDVESAETAREKCASQTGIDSGLSLAMDITSADSLASSIDLISGQFGKIDALVNCAYPRTASWGADLFDISYEDFKENLGLQLGGYFLSSQQFAKYFLVQGHGNIVNLSSIYGVIAPKFDIYNNTGMTMPIEYATIKSGLIHLTRYMAKYLKGKNIRINCISPGGVENSQPSSFQEAYGQHCLNKGMLDADDLSGTLLFLLSDQSRYINGQNIIVDDGFTL